MQEKTAEEITGEEVKAFMNEPEPEEKAPEPMMNDDWADSPEQKAQDYKLTSADIAELAFNTVQVMECKFGTAFLPQFWSELEAEKKQYYAGIVNFFINSAANPNGHESCQALHDLMLDAKLRDGWTYGEMYSEPDKKDPMMLSYKGLPPHLKAKNFLFRCVVIGLVAVWKGH